MSVKRGQIVIRVETQVIARAEKLRAQAERTGFPISTATIYRQALERGLSVLERRARRNR